MSKDVVARICKGREFQSVGAEKQRRRNKVQTISCPYGTITFPRRFIRQRSKVYSFYFCREIELPSFNMFYRSSDSLMSGQMVCLHRPCGVTVTI